MTAEIDGLTKLEIALVEARAALETLRTHHRFNIAVLSPSMVHSVCFMAIEGIDEALK